MKPNKAAKFGLTGSGSRRDVFTRVRHGTVAIATGPLVRPGQPFDMQLLRILGTGFVVDNRGVVLTAKHVVEPIASSLMTMQPAAQQAAADILKIVTEAPPTSVGSNYSMNWHVADVKGVLLAKELDLAGLLFTVDPAIRSSFEALSLSSDPCRQGDEVGICGYPFGHDLHAEVFNKQRVVIPSFSSGIVSVVFPHPDAPLPFQSVFQMDAMVNGGNSGGPIFKPGTGEVVGVVVQSVTIKSRVLTDPAGPDAEKPSPLQDPASGIFFQQQIPTGLSRGIHIHQAAQLIIDAAAGLN